MMKLNLIQAFQTASSILMGTSFLYLEKKEIQKPVEKQFLYWKTLLARGCPIVKVQAMNQFVKNNNLQKKVVYFTCISELFKEISSSLCKALKNYDKIVLAGDLNIDLLDPSKDILDHLCDQLDVFNLTNLIEESTYFMPDKRSLIDIILTMKPRSFHKANLKKLLFPIACIAKKSLPRSR